MQNKIFNIICYHMHSTLESETRGNSHVMHFQCDNTIFIFLLARHLFVTNLFSRVKCMESITYDVFVLGTV